MEEWKQRKILWDLHPDKPVKMKNLIFKDNYTKNAGFTLLELLISIAIIMVIMTILGSAFRLGIKSVEKGEKAIDEQRRYMTAVNYIYRQMEAVCLNEDSVFQGTKESIKFHAVLNAGMEGESTKEIMYRVSKSGDDGVMNLEVSRKDAFPLGGEKNEEEVDTVLSGVSDFSLQYLGNSGKGKMWIDEWKDEHYFPLAVKMKFTYANRSAVIFVRNLKTKRKFL